jgi:hypothetical protein
MFALVIMIGFTTSGFSQRKKTTVIVKKHKPVRKVVYVKQLKKNVKPSIGSVVYQLSNNAKTIVVNKSRYIRHNNVLYTKVIVRGRNAYKVVRYYS